MGGDIKQLKSLIQFLIVFEKGGGCSTIATAVVHCFQAVPQPLPTGGFGTDVKYVQIANLAERIPLI